MPRARRRGRDTEVWCAGTIAYGPIWDWQRAPVFEYLAGRGIEPNPLYRTLADLGVPEQLIRVDSIIYASQLSNGHIAWVQRGLARPGSRCAHQVAANVCTNGGDTPIVLCDNSVATIIATLSAGAVSL